MRCKLCPTRPKLMQSGRAFPHDYKCIVCDTLYTGKGQITEKYLDEQKAVEDERKKKQEALNTKYKQEQEERRKKMAERPGNQDFFGVGRRTYDYSKGYLNSKPTHTHDQEYYKMVVTQQQLLSIWTEEFEREVLGLFIDSADKEISTPLKSNDNE